jgi:hypothetical protein
LASTTPTLRPSTARRYRDIARLHIIGVIGNLRLAKLSPGDVQRLYADRLTSGLSPTSVNHIRDPAPRPRRSRPLGVTPAGRR